VSRTPLSVVLAFLDEEIDVLRKRLALNSRERRELERTLFSKIGERASTQKRADRYDRKRSARAAA
jgi:hypothetical protein